MQNLNNKKPLFFSNGVQRLNKKVNSKSETVKCLFPFVLKLSFNDLTILNVT